MTPPTLESLLRTGALVIVPPGEIRHLLTSFTPTDTATWLLARDGDTWEEIFKDVEPLLRSAPLSPPVRAPREPRYEEDDEGNEVEIEEDEDQEEDAPAGTPTHIAIGQLLTTLRNGATPIPRTMGRRRGL